MTPTRTGAYTPSRVESNPVESELQRRGSNTVAYLRSVFTIATAAVRTH